LHLRLPLFENRGRREDRVRAAPAVSRANAHKQTHTSIQVQRKHSGLPCAVVYGLLRALPGDRLSCHRRFAGMNLRNLTPAPGRQDHTTSPSAQATLVSRGFRVHRIPPHVRDDREPPLVRVRRDELVEMICPTSKAEYFSERGWTLICPTGEFRTSRRSNHRESRASAMRNRVLRGGPCHRLGSPDTARVHLIKSYVRDNRENVPRKWLWGLRFSSSDCFL